MRRVLGYFLLNAFLSFMPFYGLDPQYSNPDRIRQDEGAAWV